MSSTDPNEENNENYHLKKDDHEIILNQLDEIEEDKKKYPDEFEKEIQKVLINLTNEKCPTVSYYAAKSFPETKLFVYNLATYVVPLYDDLGQKLPQIAVDGETKRGAFLFKTLIILALQLVCTITFMIGGVFIKPSDEFNQKNHTGIVCICAIAFVLYCLIYYSPWFRKTFPCNYVVLTTFTLCSTYALGSFHAEFNDPMNLLYTLGGVFGILILLFIASCIPCCLITSSGFYKILNQILPLMFITLLIASIYSLHYNVFFLLFIFLVEYLFLECFFILHIFHLILGRGGSHAMRTDEHILTSVLLYIHINTVHLILLLLISILPYALVSLALAIKLKGLINLFPRHHYVSEGVSKLSEGASKVSQGASKGASKFSDGIAAVNKSLNFN